MGIFKRNQQAQPDPPEEDSALSVALMEGTGLIEQSAAAHQAQWGLGSADRWDVDQPTGTIRFTFADKVVTAPVQMLGSWSRANETFMWAWANPSVDESLSRDAARVKAFGERHDWSFLVADTVPANEEQAADMVAVAFRITGATGFYRGGNLPIVPYLTFGPEVTITPTEGEATTISVKGPPPLD